MKKLALAALLAVSAASIADAAVVITFSGTDTVGGTSTPVSGTITIDPSKLPLNSGAAGDTYYYSDSIAFMSVVVNGVSLPLPGGLGDNTIESHADGSSPSSYSVFSETNSGQPNQQTYGFSINSLSGIPLTTAFGGVALPDFRAAFADGQLFFALESYGMNNANYSLLSGNVDTLTYSEVTADVPEPASWAMMVGGFGLIGGAMRRRRTTVAFA